MSVVTEPNDQVSGAAVSDAAAAETGQPEMALELEPAAAPMCTGGFVLFLILTGVLIVRPAEIVTSLVGLPIYQVFIVASLLASLPVVLEQLTMRSLLSRPVTVCVIALLPCIMLSHLAHLRTWEAREDGMMFLKVILYYLLLVGLVDSPSRLRVFLSAVVLFVAISAALTLMNYHGYADIPALAPIQDRTAEGAGSQEIVVRLRASGIFNDPNDFSLILVASLAICTCFVVDKTRSISRFWWLGIMLVCGYALSLTRSRGGFLSLVAASLVIIVSRFGWRKAMPVLGVVLPALLVLFAGRQTNIDLSNKSDTAQGRLLLWREGLELLKENPVFGIGSNMFSEEVGHVAHNSFVHTYTELGFFGGTFFLGMVYLLVSWMRQPVVDGGEEGRSELIRMRPYMGAVVVAYAVGLVSLSRAYALSTYMVMGVVHAYCTMIGSRPRPELSEVNYAMIKRLLIVSVVCLLSIYLFVREFVQ